VTTTDIETARGRYAVRRSTRRSRLALGALAVAGAALAAVPLVLSTYATEQLTELFILAILAAMWNALAGYGGLISIGQQAFVGAGAYATILLTQRGTPPYLAIAVAALAAGALALPISLLVLRLRGGQFAIGTWVVAEVLALLVALDHGVGGGTGVSLTGLNVHAPADRQAYTYWMTLGFGALLLGLAFALLRSPAGAALQAIRDDEQAAASLGVRVDTGVEEGGEIPVYYDSMIAKLIVHGRDREEARALMRDALNGFVIRGVASSPETCVPAFV